MADRAADMLLAEPEGHCRTCLVKYLKGKVQDRSYPIKCPHFCPTRAVGLAALKRYLTAEVRPHDCRVPEELQPLPSVTHLRTMQ